VLSGGVLALFQKRSESRAQRGNSRKCASKGNKNLCHSWSDGVLKFRNISFRGQK
jgi:hypothetical protein